MFSGTAWCHGAVLWVFVYQGQNVTADEGLSYSASISIMKFERQTQGKLCSDL